MNTKKFAKFSLKIAVVLIVFILVFTSSNNYLQAQTVEEINQQISDIKQKIDDLQKQQAVYQKNIRIKQEEAVTLNNELDILTNKIAATELEIKTTDQEIKKNSLELRQAEIDILKNEDAVDKKKKELGELLKQLQKVSNSNPLEIFVLNNSISDFFLHIENTKILTNNLEESVSTLKLVKKELEQEKLQIENKQQDLKKLEKQLDLQKAELSGEVIYKDQLLVETKESEEKFYDLYWQAKQEQENANSEIYNLEKIARSKLDDNTGDKPELTDSTLIWPVTKNTITAQFHDTSYPFRNLFEHPAIDIRAAQGTPIKAAADGYVLKALDAGMGYSYIALIHADGLSTVYGHVSAIYVKPDEYVTKGEVIGLSGGMPGSPGAGRLTTGPHLHFEVRLNGIPVNPVLYLP
ncbi:hypothetical protein A2300_04280 [Candidatus Falkowbacteria bacterium RIFOXYB2_FULL_35_7]|uniref:M23ase beta-sheet core domain-containing protein n=1 Tax=Candidatus Falkowbacteria bacterium RIFOXYC2_FULL_36_12 TaxID=1798002 RepID=A0A1F5SY93_9BACT|nr:MAG: hypothetical protein A2300_04280 [Candidatus Falkowbacteria bacterium RIFOXYB2_FULL_35_7]OGF31609.1 MAG: hypothetical protein A2478_03930 [Candidatus Falkowbacteria bacterium RIFOXYC2_FULL_36_12]